MVAQKETQVKQDIRDFCEMKQALGYEIGHCTSLEAEIWAVYRGLTILFQRGVTNVEIETNSEQAIHQIQYGPSQNSPFKALIEDAEFLLKSWGPWGSSSKYTIPVQWSTSETASFMLGLKEKKLSNSYTCKVGDITGFYMIDEDGALQSVDVSAKFVNVSEMTEAKYITRSPIAWDRLMRFMKRYAN
ncbi:hypothetical protein TEA_013701 [Camellia sinensis var. sinensis]|uniref:Photosystem II reaction center Psb28 protein n=1 Tax=Camellia sinensis var. sinensis TaxID=542762 RepID=A0A4S4DFK1_CAMSN|nr:hypothetical protein TEA_013701 [Camellia sinensis var. sinensis]